MSSLTKTELIARLKSCLDEAEEIEESEMEAHGYNIMVNLERLEAKIYETYNCDRHYLEDYE